MSKSLRNFSSFMTVAPDLPHERPKICNINTPTERALPVNSYTFTSP